MKEMKSHAIETYKVYEHKKVLFLIIILGSFSNILVFGDPFEELLSLNDLGIKALNEGNYEEAITYFDEALQIDPTFVIVLSNKGVALNLLEQYYESHTYFQKALDISPTFVLAVDGQAKAKSQMYKPIDGVLDIIVRNSQGNLVIYMKTTNLLVLDHEIANEELDKWPVKEIISLDGKQFEVLKNERTIIMPRDWVYSNYVFPLPVNSKVGVIAGNYFGYVSEIGDQVKLLFTVFRPLE